MTETTENDCIGSIAATLVAAGAGAAACGVFYVLGAVKAIGRHLNLYAPSGTLSGASTAAILLWLGTWFVLSWRWKGRQVNLQRAGLTAMLLVMLGVLLTFPPVARLFS